MAELKTFVFTDIAGSVQLKNEMPGRSTTERDQAFIRDVLTPHRERIEAKLADHAGRVVSTAGDGHFLVFADTILAARWAVSVQESHLHNPITTSSNTQVKCRVSIHVGIPQIDPQDPSNFVGKPVDYAARLNDYAKAEQILVSRSVVAILEDAGLDDIFFHSHGHRDLKGIGHVEVHELMFGDLEPQPTRNKPVEKFAREWTAVPTSMGLTEFFTSTGTGSSSGLSATLQQVGNYELEALLGSGGMGDVYKARHTQFGKVRAVKIIKQHFVDAGHDEIIKRFYQEIKAVGRLEHPNIVVAIESSAPTDSVHFLVMEYIDGLSVEQQIKARGPMQIADACEIARQAAGGLQYIYQNGMVHRDVKPSNLMLSTAFQFDSGGSSLASSTLDGRSDADQGVVKILDLGLALLATEESERLTRFDARAMGTGMYMAPEQWRTTSVDVRADIYSLGCSLYHMLAGQPPFVDSELRPKIAHEKSKLPKIRRSDVAVPSKLWNVLQKMVAKNPAERYSTPAEVAEALAPFCVGHDLTALVREHRHAALTESTTPNAKGETELENSAYSDTQAGGLPGTSWGRGELTGPIPLSRRARLLRMAATTAGLVAIVALAIMAGRWTGSSQKTRDAHLKDLSFKAVTAAEDIAEDIQERIRILVNQSKRTELSRNIRELTTAEDSEAAGSDEEVDLKSGQLSDWIMVRRTNSLSNAPSDSWFLTDEIGRQIARHEKSSSLWKNYSHRDYFHGQGAVTPNAPQPINEPHQSDVYRSTSSGMLKVAFSVPVWSGRRQADRKVVGVLAMSVDLGAFNVLEDKLDPNDDKQVLLIDTGSFSIDGETGEGLVLHHHGGPPFGKDDPLPVLRPQTLQLIRDALKYSDGKFQADSAALENYNDPQLTGGKPYWGAMHTVDSELPETAERTNWVVLVQEPVKR